MQIKPTRRYCFIPTRKVTIVKTKPQIISIEKDGGKLVPLYIIDRKWKIFDGSSKIKHRIADKSIAKNSTLKTGIQTNTQT